MVTNTKNASMMQPYTMCSIEECNERIRTNEVSIFEMTTTATTTTTTTTSTKNEQQQQPPLLSTLFLDPTKAVSKYRRSAAGLDRSATYKQPRSYKQLLITIKYLIQLLFVSIPEMCLAESNNNSNKTVTTMSNRQQKYTQKIVKWMQLVQFVEDRIRAIQVDIVVSSNKQTTKTKFLIKQIQYYCTICHVLILYFTYQQPEYQSKFGYDALSTSLLNYWNTTTYVSTTENNVHNDDQANIRIPFDNNDGQCNTAENEEIMDDEMLALFVVVELNRTLLMLSQNHYQQEGTATQLGTNGDINEGLFDTLSFTTLYRNTILQLQQQSSSSSFKFQNMKPKLTWTLQLLSNCITRRWYIVLRMLQEGITPDPLPECPLSSLSSSSNFFDNLIQKYNRRFRILVRCCISPLSLLYIRYQIIQQYNTIVQKNHSVSCIEIGRLLFLFSESMASTTDNNQPQQEQVKNAWDDDDDDDDSNSEIEQQKHVLTYNESKVITFGKVCGIPIQERETSTTEHRNRSLIGHNPNNTSVIHCKNTYTAFFLQFKAITTLASFAHVVSKNDELNQRDDYFVLSSFPTTSTGTCAASTIVTTHPPTIQEKNWSKNNDSVYSHYNRRTTTDGIELPSSKWFMQNIFYFLEE